MRQRLIDANAYAAELWKLRENYQMLDDTHTADKIMHGIFRAEQTLKEQPTVDAVPVVRCKECKHYRKVEDHSGICVVLAREEQMTDDFFCADGERKEQDDATN